MHNSTAGTKVTASIRTSQVVKPTGGKSVLQL